MLKRDLAPFTIKYMKKSIFCSLIVVSTLFIVSCGKKDPVLSIFPGRTHSVAVSETIMLDGKDMTNALFVSKYNDWIIFRFLYNAEDPDMFAFYNPKEDKFFKGGSFGDGPAELTNISSYSTDGNILYVFGPTEKRFIKVDIEESIAAEEVKVYGAPEMGVIDLFNITRVYPLNNELFIGNQYTGTGDSWYSLYDGSNNIVSSVPFTDFDVIKDMTAQQKNSIHMQSYASVKPDKRRVVVAGLTFGAISFSEVDGQTLNEYKRYELAPPVIDNDASQMIYTDPNTTFFTPIVSDDNSILAIYRGLKNDAPFGHTYDILEFNWAGEPVRHYKLSDAITDIILDNEEGCIWGLVREPQVKIVKYKLN